MYAVVQCGSKQYIVKKGDSIHVDLFEGEPGQEIELSNVLMVSKGEGEVQIGDPTVAGALVKARYVAEIKGPKITSVKYKRRKNQYRKFGHRQRYAHLEITEIQG